MPEADHDIITVGVARREVDAVWLIHERGEREAPLRVSVFYTFVPYW